MLIITIPGDEFYDEEKEEFFTRGDVTLELEHSLAAISKWESIHEKPFLSEDDKSSEEVYSYIHCMIIDSKTPPEVLERLDEASLTKINDYINSKQTATWFKEAATGPSTPKRSNEKITSELIYYWMIAFQIPWEAQHWNIERLFTLLKICHIKNSKPQKMDGKDAAAQRARLNAERMAQYGTTG